MAIEMREYVFRSCAISVKTPYEELIDHIKKEEVDGWKLFTIQAIVGTPFTYLVTMYRE